MRRVLLFLLVLGLGSLSAAYATDNFYFSGASTGNPGDQVTIVVGGTNDVAIRAYAINFLFDPAVFDYVSSTLVGTRGAGAMLPTLAGTDGSATAGVIYSFTCPPSIPAGTGSLFIVTLQIHSNAPAGTTTLDLRDVTPSYNRMSPCAGGTTFPTLTDGTFEVLSAPVCSVDPTSLNFGSVQIGSSADRTFSITNTGGGTLSGTVSESCVDYSIVSGAAYSLTAGQSQTVTVRFTPTTSGTLPCSIDTGNAGCADVACTGSGYAPPACSVTPTSLDFGQVQIGSSFDRAFSITNTGGGTLAGTVSESCTDYSIVSGASYSLTAGQSQTVTVQFAPTTAGPQACTIDMGNPGCEDVSCTGSGYPPPACSVTPISLDFGQVQIGSSFDRTFSITNTGGGTLAGTVSEPCADYSIFSGAEYSLTAGQSQTVTVRFTPTTSGPLPCTIDTGNTGCSDVSCTGSGYPPPACSVTPISLDFGQVQIGSSFDRTFSITNTGGGTLSGTVTESCPGYSIVSGAEYSLTAGQSQTVTVQFAPTTAGPQACTIDTGDTGCEDVSCTGSGYPPPACSVTPISLDFGQVQIGSSFDRTFSITNTGGGTLAGTVTESCAGYSIVSGAAYSLTAGQSQTVTVRFAPTSSETLLCTVDTGDAGCADVACTGTGYPPPACSVVPTSLDFGSVQIGSSFDRSFSITNTGGGTLSGTVSESCADYSIFSGATYSLTAGQSQTVVVRFTPTTSGTLTCTIDTGDAGCVDVACTGSGYPPPACLVAPTSLDFGNVQIGSSADRNFSITNTGGGTLSGTVAETCTDYSIVSGAGYSLTAGQSQTVVVRFAPTTSGTLLCSIDTGNIGCEDVACTGSGYPPPACSVTPISLDFGNVQIGSSADRNFSITNTGGGTLSGTVAETCTDYSIVSGAGYSLTAGQSQTVVVRFSPTTSGTQLCTIDTGDAGCVDVACTGSGYPPPACLVAPTSLDFGNVQIGSSADRNFSITNTGGGTLSGTVAETCTDYSIVSGAGYSLTAGQSQTVVVRFAPTTSGTQLCTIDTGDAGCVDVACTGSGYPPPACSVTPISLDFGNVQIGSSADRNFSITNTGGGTLSGTVSETCTDYSIVSGASYSLTAGQSQTVVVRFAPTTSGTLLCSIDTGNIGCEDVACTGSGYLPPACSVTPISLDFGNVQIGSSADRNFSITNTGGGTLSGTVTELCTGYSIVSGAGYSLTAGQSQTVTVQFAPTTSGTLLCSIDTGNIGCEDVSCTGSGYPPPACSVTPISLDFGNVQIGSSADRNFSITNTGGGTLSGTVSESCAGYSIVSGAAYSLTAGQSQTVVVRFSPTTSGTLSCTIDTGDTGCADVACTGVGYPPPACSVTPISLDFGSVQIGSSFDRTFSITNTGGGTLAGTVTESCADYSIFSGAVYSLTAGQSQTVVVRFTPTTSGTLTCTIDTGDAGCADVACTGSGYPPPACSVVPTSLDFGSVQIGSSFDRTFSITNTGGGTLSGTVSESCTDYSIVSGAEYSLTAGQSQTVTVRFTPTTSGTQLCTIDTGDAGCADVACTGSGYPPPACSVVPTSLDFGSVQIGSSADRNFSITNTGGGTLAGTVTESCAGYSIVSGAGYSLTAGQSQTVVVRFTPTTSGAALCSIDTGNIGCEDVSCTGSGYPAPACSVVPTSLDFGSVQIGSSADRNFSITNTGGGTLSGTVGELCASYSIVSGAAYSLTAGQSQTVVVRFAPTTSGTLLCSIDTGNIGCEDVACTGSGYPPPACSVVPTSLDFGSVQIGSSADRNFSITNTGGGTLSGTVTESCASYSIVSGAGYSLTAGQSQTVVVRFAPTTAGTELCTIDTGDAGCVDVTCTGTGYPAPACLVAPTSLDFGNVQIGSSADRNFSITNTGGGTLSGTVTEPCADYSIVSGAAYSLTAGQSQTVVVRFAPTTSGTLLCSIDTGNPGCTDVSCTGSGYPPPACSVTPISLDFGSVQIGSSFDRTFSITNTGGGTLAGTVTESCADYSIFSGAEYSLTAGQSQTVTVRFTPASSGTLTCSIDTGNPGCTDVSCTGSGYPPPACLVAPTSLDFGNVQIGSSADRNFSITNTGGGTLAGTVTESCAGYSIVSGAGYSLTAGQSQTVVVRFAPTTSGTQLCTIDTGDAGCVDVSCTGVGYPAPACSVTPTSLDFGNVQIGSSADRNFSITNTGGGTLSGTVTESCAGYSIVSGAGYSLTAGQSQTVVVRFAPTTSGTELCTIDTGDAGCVDVSCTGSGYPVPACLVAPTSLDFGNVQIGSSADRNFSITNTGGGTLAGTVTESCAGYSIVSGAGYSLTAGQSQTVVVRFAPTTSGTLLCSIDTGNIGCEDVSCTGSGYPPPACLVTPISLDFGNVQIGSSADRNFSITNTGGGTLSGTATESCADYSIVSGAGYSLTAGQSQTVVVRFAPTTSGTELCTIDTGDAGCVDVSCTGTGYPAPACLVAPTSLDFGNVQIGSSADRNFSITNTGGGTLAGTVTESCAGYSIVSGAGYSLTAGQSQTVVVRFAPTTSGTLLCSIDTGNVGCEDVSCTGTGYPAPACLVAPTSLDFGNVQIGSSADRNFSITNTGGGTLSGTVAETCTDYSIVSGAGYSLTAGQSQTVVVRFSPTTSGTQLCTIDTGDAGCVDVSCTGTGYPPPACSVVPTSLDFGSVQIGSSADRNFSITNTGGGTLSGTVTESCASYSIVSGAGYSLTAGQSQTVVVRFAPTTSGTLLCSIDTGNIGCEDVSCTGTGYPPPACSVVPTSLDFGSVQIGSSADRNFSITNIGGGTLSGTVTESCASYSIVSGAGYSLTAGQSQTVVVRFAPTTSGTLLCSIDTGNIGCEDVSCTGTGYPPPACSVVPTSLDFGSVQIGSSADRNFSITNTGGGTLSGTASESCASYSIVSGAAYSLTAGQSQTVVVRFAPTTSGTLLCSIDTGNTGCEDVACTGSGYPAPACSVVPTSLDFGSVQIGSSADRNFSITNTGGGTLSGTVTESCAGYSIVSGAAYSLTAGQSQTVVVRFAPTTSGTLLCSIDTGNIGCEDVSCTGSGYPAPACSVTPVSLDFGQVQIGSSADRNFSITNTGGGTLSGTVTESCASYSIVSGAAYSLTAGQSQTVVVRFAPTTSGTLLCSIDTGNIGCEDVSCTGSGYPAPACSVTPISLDFGSVQIGSSADRNFSITNTGGGTLSGTVTESCTDYSIVSGATYSLTAGQSQPVMVRFAPTTSGTQLCTIDTGNAGCEDVACTGVGYSPSRYFISSDAEASPGDTVLIAIGSETAEEIKGYSINLLFDHETFQYVGSTLQGTRGEGAAVFTPGNTDSTARAAVVYRVQCPPSIPPGTGPLLIVTLRVRNDAPMGMTALDLEDLDAALNRLTLCDGATRIPQLQDGMLAIVERPECSINPPSLLFGEVALGDFSDLSFTIANVGTGTLTGTVSETCLGFSIVAGGGAYALNGGESKQVTVRFAPPEEGNYMCMIETGPGLCADVACQGSVPVSDIGQAEKKWITEIVSLAPNPSSGWLSIRFSLQSACPARVAVYDLGGRVVRRLAWEPLPAGLHSATWDGLSDSGSSLPAGVYYVRLSACGKNISRPVITLD